MQNQKTALILPAAGVGVRLGMIYPKAMLYINRKPLIHFILERAKKAKIFDVFIVTGPDNYNFFNEFFSKYFVLKKFNIRFLTNKSDSLPGSVISGCFAASMENFSKYIIALPDTSPGNIESIKQLSALRFPSFGLFDQPAHKFDAVYLKKNGEYSVVVKKKAKTHLGEFLGTWGLLALTKKEFIDIYDVYCAKKSNNEVYDSDKDKLLLGDLLNIVVKKGTKWKHIKLGKHYKDYGTWEEIIKEYFIKGRK